MKKEKEKKEIFIILGQKSQFYDKGQTCHEIWRLGVRLYKKFTFSFHTGKWAQLVEKVHNDLPLIHSLVGMIIHLQFRKRKCIDVIYKWSLHEKKKGAS